MFHAFGAAKRSMDLSRQVACVITNGQKEILATGWNDIHGFGHPLTQESPLDIKFFDYNKGENFNKSIMTEIAEKITAKIPAESNIKKEDIKKELEELIGYHRPVCAEMSAILDAARRGVSIRNGSLYCTTYPCHICMKHIISAGIIKVVYIEPYPKSKTSEMFNDLVSHGTNCDCIDKVNIVPFIGISPKRYLYAFNAGSRSDENEYSPSMQQHLSNKYSECYEKQEESVINKLKNENIQEDSWADKIINNINQKRS